MLLTAARDAFTNGMRLTAMLTAVVALAIAMLASVEPLASRE